MSDKLSKFSSKLGEELSKSYCIFGENSFQIQELTEEFYELAKNDAYETKEVHIINNKTDWSFLSSSEENFDLFSSKKIIEIKLVGSGPGREGAKAITNYVSSDNKDKILLITAEGLDRKSRSSSWIRSLKKSGKAIDIPPISLNQLPQWIISKGKECQIEIEKDAAILLSEKTEGNLEATFQEIKKLSLVLPNNNISLKEMAKFISNSSKYDIFDLSRNFVLKNKKKTLTILESLKVEGIPESLILWALARDISNLFKVKLSGSTRGVWGPRSYLSAVEITSKDITKKKISSSLKQIAFIDSCIKGGTKTNSWQALRDLCLSF